MIRRRPQPAASAPRVARGALVAVALLVGAAASPAALAPAAAEPAAASEPLNVFETLLAAKAPSIVSIKLVLRVSSGGRGEEGASEVRGVVVDPSGLVLANNDDLDGPMAMMRAMGMAGDASVSPSDLKVLFENEATEHPAVLVARDSTLGVAFVQIVDLAGRVPAAVDLSAGATPRIGEALYGITRKSRGFDCAPTIDRLVVNGRVEKPRPLLSVSGAFAGKGLPVFDERGRPVGIYSHQEGSEGVSEGPRGLGALLGAIGGSNEGSCILPLDAVVRSLEAARKRVPAALAKAKESAASTDAPADPATPAPTAPTSPPDAPPPVAPKPPEQPK